MLYTDVSEHCSIFICAVSRNNNRDEIVRVFIWERVWLEKTEILGIWETERGRVRVENQAVEGGQIKHVREKERCSKGGWGDMGW